MQSGLMEHVTQTSQYLLQEVAVGRQGNGLSVANAGEDVGNEQVLRVESNVQEEPAPRI